MDVKNKIQFQNYLKLFYSKRWLILSFSFFGLLLSLLYLNFTRSEYVSSSTLIIDKNESGAVISDPLFSSSFETELQNHIEHLRSYKISKLVLEYIEENKNNYLFSFEFFGENEHKFSDEGSKVRWLMNRFTVERQNRFADVIKLGFRAYRPEEAAAIINIYQDVYIKESFNFVETELVSLKKYLIDKIYEKEKLLLTAEDEANSFKQRENINILSEQTKEAINTIANINAKKAQYQIELEGALESKRAVEAQITSNSEKLKNSNIDINTNYFSRLVEEISSKKALKLKMDARLENLGLSKETFQTTFKQLTDEITALEEQLEEQTKLKSSGNSFESSYKLAEELQSKYLELDIKIKSLQKSLSAIDDYLKDNEINNLNLPDKELQLTRLMRDVAKHEKIAEMLAYKLEETEIRLSSRKNYVKILDRALVNSKPIHPQKAIILAGGLASSLFMIVGIVFLIEYLDNTVKTEEEIEYFNLNRLGLIPNITTLFENGKSQNNNMESRLVTHLNPHSMVAEAYKSLRTNLSFQMKKDPNKKSFLISSCGPQEGKSTTASNVAISFANQGKKVILVDTDLRKPVIHSIFGLEKQNGFVEILMNELTLDQVYKQTQIDNLYIITSGYIPPNPSELLSLDRVSEIVGLLKEEFDVVIFDTPPIIAVTDAAILSEKIDSVILVIRANVTDRDMISEAVSKLTKYNDNLIGSILNDFNFERHYGYRYQYYSYYNQDSQ